MRTTSVTTVLTALETEDIQIRLERYGQDGGKSNHCGLNRRGFVKICMSICITLAPDRCRLVKLGDHKFIRFQNTT